MELRAEQKELLAGVPNDGSAVGNVTLRKALGWSFDRYFAVRDSLVDADLLALGKGKGGSVRRVVIDPNPTVVFEREIDLYPSLRKVIQHEWARARRTTPIAVAVTGTLGRADTGGTWTRPDLTCVALRTFTYVPGTHLDVTTFEVKRAEALDVRAVFEAVAHRRAATEVYVLAYTPFGSTDEDFRDVTEVAAAHGVGLITADDPSDFDTWDERVSARRFPTDPALLDDFIRKQLPAADREVIANAFGRSQAPG